MAVVSVQAQLTTQQLLDAIGQLDTLELEQIARHVARLRTRQRKADTSARETQLLKTIRHPRPLEFQRHYRALMQKRREETLTPEEHEELLRLTEQAEEYDLQRLKALMELADRRQTDIDTLLQTLGIRPSADA